MFVCLSIFLLALDQITKYIVSTNMVLGSSIPLLGDLFQITYVHNIGAAFSILQGKTGLLTIFAIVVSLGMAYAWLKTPKENKGERFCFALIIAGAIGNVIDRIRLGYVVDFFHWHNFPVFNVADICLVVGIFLLCFLVIWESVKDEKAKKQKVALENAENKEDKVEENIENNTENNIEEKLENKIKNTEK